MPKETTNTTNNDILSGKGLKPISPTSQTTQTSGITTENRGQDKSGFRLDLFSKGSSKKQQ